MRPVLLAMVLVLSGCAAPALSGTHLERSPAPELTLTDGATGERVSLSSLRGKVVALAFLYTRCPDVCPLTATHFARARGELGADASRVVFVAVSTDPLGDTPQRVRDFSAAHGLGEGWHYLIGSREQLQPVWQAYGIHAAPGTTQAVTHTDAIYLIDAQGRERSLVRSADLGEHLVDDLRILLGEG
ncbi:MAG TPA: SCO family protein [Candidatus Limnocylindrales bacterium]|nr:SCO family protein [Candidatus Limnocylindrales bacterium]